MRAARLHEHGDPEVLHVEEIDRPEPTAHELLVEVAASGVNPVDTYFREGSYTPVGLPFTPGVDFAGTVVDVGTAVDDLAPDDRVFGTGIGNVDHQGALAEFAVVPADRAVRLPDEVDLLEAGAAGNVAVTAWRALLDHGGLGPGEVCLVHGGSGGVGHAAVQIGAAVNARVIATAAEAYHDAVGALGAETVLDYDRDDLAAAVNAAADGGVDVVLDHRLDDYLQFDAEVTAPFGRVVGIGETDPTPGFSDDRVARSKELSYTFMSMFNTPDLRVPLRGVAHLLATGALEIAIERRYPLEEAGEAHRAVMAESFLGKLVVEP